MNVICSKNSGYKWTNYKNAFFKGYIQLNENEILREEQAIDYFLSSTSFEEFTKILGSCFGCFAVILEKPESTWAAVDIARSIPLYYSSDLSLISDSGEAIRKCIGGTNPNPLRLLEMYATSYIVHENTVYDQICQIEIGHAVEITDASIIEKPYYVHFADVNNISRDEAKEKLAMETDRMIDRILKVVNDRPIVISLSGGYDSRYLACSLKKHGVDSVICYTYGSKKSFEIQQSKLVADALGYKWHCVYYDDDNVSLLSMDNDKYFEYCDEHDYIVYIQNYVAIKKLIIDGVIPDNAVFLTGLCNDMPTGFYTPTENEAKRYGFSESGVAHYIVDSRFTRFKLKKEVHDLFLKDVLEYIESYGLTVSDYQSFVSVLDCITTGYSHSRCFLNMNKPHEFFGHEWLLPCWDKNLLKLWYSLPSGMRYKQNLYEEYITEDLAANYGVGSKKYINRSAKTPQLSKIKRLLGGIAVKISYPLGIPVRRNTDINNFAPLEIALYKRIRQKKAVKPERAAITLLLSIYLMEKRYGTDWFSNVSQYIDE